MELFRPVGLLELRLIAEAGWRCFPPRLPEQVVGASRHRELWVPAEQLVDFQAGFLGPIELRESFFGERFAEEVDDATGLPRSVSRLRPDPG